MRPEDLALFSSPLLPDEPLRFEGESVGEHLHDGLLCAGRHVVGFVEDGVPSLVAPNTEWSERDLADLRDDGHVRRNWETWRSGDVEPKMLEIAAEVAETDGVLLEIACGPGAGLTPRALLTDPDRRVILNDICTGVLQLHREYLAETGLGANVICMAFDASERVMRPATVDVVSGFLALSFMGGQDANDRGLNAAYEALVPGGKLFIVDKSYDPEEIKLLPVDVRKRLAMDRRTSWPDRLAEVGFEIDECERFPSQAESDPDESVFAKEALAVGVTLQSYAEFVIATKA